ncbi:hypothetical protein MMPV_003998 [Pyropia vietnamensis]
MASRRRWRGGRVGSLVWRLLPAAAAAAIAATIAVSAPAAGSPTVRAEIKSGRHQEVDALSIAVLMPLYATSAALYPACAAVLVATVAASRGGTPVSPIHRVLVVGAASKAAAGILLAILWARLRATLNADAAAAVAGAASTAVTGAAAIDRAARSSQRSVNEVISMTAVVPAVLADLCLAVSILLACHGVSILEPEWLGRVQPDVAWYLGLGIAVTIPASIVAYVSRPQLVVSLILTFVGGGVVTALAVAAVARSVRYLKDYAAVVKRSRVDPATTPVAARIFFFRAAASGVVLSWAARLTAALLTHELIPVVALPAAIEVLDFLMWAGLAIALRGRRHSPLLTPLTFDDSRLAMVRAQELAVRSAAAVRRAAVTQAVLSSGVATGGGEGGGSAPPTAEEVAAATAAAHAAGVVGSPAAAGASALAGGAGAGGLTDRPTPPPGASALAFGGLHGSTPRALPLRVRWMVDAILAEEEAAAAAASPPGGGGRRSTGIGGRRSSAAAAIPDVDVPIIAWTVGMPLPHAPALLRMLVREQEARRNRGRRRRAPPPPAYILVEEVSGRHFPAGNRLLVGIPVAAGVPAGTPPPIAVSKRGGKGSGRRRHGSDFVTVPMVEAEGSLGAAAIAPSPPGPPAPATLTAALQLPAAGVPSIGHPTVAVDASGGGPADGGERAAVPPLRPSGAAALPPAPPSSPRSVGGRCARALRELSGLSASSRDGAGCSGLPVLPPSPAQSSAQPAGHWAPPPMLLLPGGVGRRGAGEAETVDGNVSEDGEIVCASEGGGGT